MENKLIPNRPMIMRTLPTVSDVNDIIEMIGSHGDKLLFRYFESGKLLEMNYAEFYKIIHRTAAGLDKLGLRGKKVALIGDTSPEWLCTYISAIAAGCVIIPMDKELAIPEIEKFTTMVEADAIVYSSTFNEKFISMFSTHTTIKYFIPIKSDYDSTLSEKIVRFSDMLELGTRALSEGYKIPTVTDREAMCEMLFTSGTTGSSKCVMLCQKNVFSAVNAAVHTVCFTADDVIVSVLPVHHTYELMCLMAGFVYGATVCINDSLRHVLKNFALFKPTGLVLVPLFVNTMYKRIWSEAEKSGRDKILKLALKATKHVTNVQIKRRVFKSVIDAFGGRLDHIICGGAKLNPELIIGFEQFGISVYEGFGITECSPLVAVTPYYARQLGSIGPAVPGCRFRIDPNGEKSVKSEYTDEGYDLGEIQVKGSNVMLGYYNNPEANAEAFTEDGWFRTGDIGYIDSNGYLYITGRSKFVIVLENGKNVFPEEIEEYLDAVDFISECCVIGRKSDEGDEVVLTAVVYPDFSKFAKDVSDDEIKDSIRKAINAVNKKLPSFKQIKSVEIRRNEFEKTTTKKIKRQLVK